MRRSQHGFYFSEEYYQCLGCGENYFDEAGNSIKRRELDGNDWKCLECDDPIRIHVVNGSKLPPVVIRKLPEDIGEEGHELVLMRFSEEPHEVLDNTYRNGKYRIALAGHTAIQVKEEDWLNTVTGGWSGDKSKLID